MGFNSVFFVLNDLVHAIKNSPKAAAAYIYYACSGCGSSENHDRYLDIANQVAAENGEPRLHSKMLEVIQCWHADQIRYFGGGRNTMEEYELEDYVIKKDEKTGEEYRCVVLREPEWRQKQFRDKRAKDKAEKDAKKAAREAKKAKKAEEVANELAGWSEIIQNMKW